MPTWWGDSKNMEEIEFSRWLFEGRLRQCKNVLLDGLNWLRYFVGSSKSHSESSIAFIFLESPHQVDMKTVVKSSKHFFGYFNTLETHSEKCVTCGDKAGCTCNQLILWKKVDAIMHAGALHAPYASKYSEQQFVAVNVGGTANVLACGIPTVFTSTTSHTITNGQRMSSDHACAHTHVCDLLQKWAKWAELAVQFS